MSTSFGGQNIVSTEDLMREIDERISKVEADPMKELPPGVDAAKPARPFEDKGDELEASSMIDKIEQKMNGGIKPMKDQFPGSEEKEKKLSFMDRCETKLTKMAASVTYKGVVIKLLERPGNGWVASFGNGHDVTGKTKEQAIELAKKKIDEGL